MATVSEEFLSPVLRLVQGSPLEPQTKDLTTGQPLTIKTGPNAGQTTQKFFIACAGKKGDPAVEAFKAQYERVARAAFPQFFPNGGPCTNPNFSWKIVDGDGFDNNGQPNNVKEGFAGHWVFRFASSYAPRCYVRGKYGPADQIADPKVFPRGHFVRVSGTITDNIPSNKPGLYSNLGMVEWNAMGDLIISGPDAATVFGGGAPAAAAPAPHPGAAPAPAPAAGPIFTMTAAAQGFTREQYHATNWTDDALVQAGMMTITQPAAPAPQAVAPHPGILAPLAHAGSAPAPAAHAPIAAAAPGFKMTNPAGPTYAAYIAQGWTDATLIQNGHMVPA